MSLSSDRVGCEAILVGLKLFRFKLTKTAQHFVHLRPLLLGPLPCHIYPLGFLVKLSRNQWLNVCLTVVDSPDKILNPFDLNLPKVCNSFNDPTGQTLCHIQHFHVPIHDTKILELFEPFIFDQTCASDKCGNIAHLQNIVDFLHRYCCCHILCAEGIVDP